MCTVKYSKDCSELWGTLNSDCWQPSQKPGQGVARSQAVGYKIQYYGVLFYIILSCTQQWFQSFFFLLQTLQLIDWISLGANSSEMHNKVGRWRWGYHYNLFPAYKRWTQDQFSMGRHPLKDLKWTKLCLSPIQTSLEAFLGLLVKTKKKAYAKLIVVMCCQIVARKSVAPSSGDIRRRPAPMYACGQDQEFWRKK